MFGKFCVVVATLAVLGACSSSVDTNRNRGSAIIGEYEISWNNMSAISSINEGIPTEKGTGIFLFSWSQPNNPYKKPRALLSNGIEVSGDVGVCEWLRQDAKKNEEALVAECRQKVSQLPPAKPRPTLSFSKFQNLAELAVAKDGNCQWLGYDKTLDLRLRAWKGLASSKDQRLFFAKLSCNRLQ